MIIYIIIWVCKPIIIDSAVFRRSQSIVEYKIDESSNDEDYVAIRENLIPTFYLEDEKTEIRKNVQNKSKPPNNIKEEQNMVTESFYEQARRSPKKDAANISTDYDYDYLLYQYHDEPIHKIKSNSTYHFSNKGTSETGLLRTAQKLLSLRKSGTKGEGYFKVIKCLFKDFDPQGQPFDVYLQRLWNILRIWLFVYLALAIPLWCTRGLCCCFLFCKFFKPQKTIEEAKRYYILNPPGLLKTTKGHEILYEPTQRERDSYEEYEHLIRTI